MEAPPSGGVNGGTVLGKPNLVSHAAFATVSARSAATADLIGVFVEHPELPQQDLGHHKPFEIVERFMSVR
jgi:hypothetical protein